MSDSKALAIVPRSIDEVTSLAEVLAKSTLMPDALRNKVPDVVVSILAGQELGLSPMAAIRGVHVVQGKPVLSADTMVGLILGSGLAEYFMCVEDTDARVTYETKRKGAPAAQRASWTTDDTKRAGLQAKDNWRLYTRSMMKARAKAILARDAFPDVLAGCYDPSEDITPTAQFTIPPSATIEVETVQDAEVLEAPPELAQLESAGTRADLKALASKLAELPEPWKTQARTRYSDRLKEVTA